MKLTTVLEGILLLELSDAIKKKVLEKFKSETTDDEKKIMDLINSFEKIQKRVAPENRDIMKYNYMTLKQFMVKAKDELEKKGDVKNFIGFFKKNTRAVEYERIERLSKYYHEIKDDLKKVAPSMYKYWEMKSFMNYEHEFYSVYGEVVFKKLNDRFKDVGADARKRYIEGYLEVARNLPPQAESVFLMDSFEQFREFVVKANPDVQEVSYVVGTKSKFTDIGKVFDDGEFIIFAPEKRNECVRLAHGRNWCTSWQGSDNYYYKYRLRDKLTLYYVIDYSLPYDDNRFGSVILVDKQGGMRLADSANLGGTRYYGGIVLPWSEIVSKVPKLEGKKDLLVWRDFSEFERIMMANIFHTVQGDDLVEELGSEEVVEAYLEYQERHLTDVQYSNLTDKLKVKYVSLSNNISIGMVNDSNAQVLNAMLREKQDIIEATPLERLSDVYIALLTHNDLKASPTAKALRLEKINELDLGVDTTVESMGAKTMMLLLTDEMKQKRLSLRGPLTENIEDWFEKYKSENYKMLTLKPDHPLIKMLRLYPDFPMFKYLHDDMRLLNIVGNGTFSVQIPEDIGRMKMLTALNLTGGVADTIPAQICQCKALVAVDIQGSDKMNSIPTCFLKQMSDLGKRNLLFGFKISGNSLPEITKRKIKAICMSSMDPSGCKKL